MSADHHLERVRRISLSLPETTEKEAWGSPTFRVKGKMFAMYLRNHHNDGRIAVWCAAPPGAMRMLAEADPERFFIPPYMGVRGWLGLHLERHDDADLEAHLAQAYCVIAPAKLARLVGGEE